MASPEFPYRQPFDFARVYATSGGAGRPIHTPQRLIEVRQQYSSLRLNGSAHLTDLYGIKISFTIVSYVGRGILTLEQNGTTAELELRSGDLLQIDAHTTMDLACQDPVAMPEGRADLPHLRPLQFRAMKEMQRSCPFFFHIHWGSAAQTIPLDNALKFMRPLLKCWTNKWEGSAVRVDLLHTLRQNVHNIKPVTRVICFDLGPLFPGPTGERGFIQHLAAMDVARTLAQIQGNIVTLFVQDVRYTPACKTLLTDLEPLVNFANSTVAQGFDLVNDHSFIVHLNSKAVILEPAIQIAGPAGPAGMLVLPGIENVEEKWNGKWQEGPLPLRYVRGSAVESEYREKCAVVKVDGGSWFGAPEHSGINALLRAELMIRKL